MTNDTETPPIADNATQTPAPTHESKPDKMLSLAEKKMTSKLRDNVDERGNFKFKLKDYSLGYAAGKGITEIEAKEQLREMFEQEMGTDIQSYLEDDRIARGKNVNQDR